MIYQSRSPRSSSENSTRASSESPTNAENTATEKPNKLSSPLKSVLNKNVARENCSSTNCSSSNCNISSTAENSAIEKVSQGIEKGSNDEQMSDGAIVLPGEGAEGNSEQNAESHAQAQDPDLETLAEAFSKL
jgi:hypothetical protein